MSGNIGYLTLLNFTKLSGEVLLLLEETNFFGGLALNLLESLFSHFLVVSKFLSEVGPLKFRKVAHVPGIISVHVMTLLASNKLTVQSQGTHLRIFLRHKLDPPFDVPHLSTTSKLLTFPRNVLMLSLQVDAANLKSFGQHFLETFRMHVGRDSGQINHSLSFLILTYLK
jgi:hypothetical protein